MTANPVSRPAKGLRETKLHYRRSDCLKLRFDRLIGEIYPAYRARFLTCCHQIILPVGNSNESEPVLVYACRKAPESLIARSNLGDRLKADQFPSNRPALGQNEPKDDISSFDLANLRLCLQC
jgi:hypothetical protein